MNGKLNPGTPSDTRWISLDANISQDSFVLTEKREKSTSRRNAEILTAALVVLLFILAYLQLFLPTAILGEAQVSAPLMMSATAVAAGLGLYAWITRGFLPEFGIDRSKKEIWTCLLNGQGRARVRRHFATDDVKSIYVFRQEGQFDEAALYLRVRNKVRPICLVRGRAEEIKSAHDHLCKFLRADQVVEAAKAARRKPAVTAKRVKPSVFAAQKRA